MKGKECFLSNCCKSGFHRACLEEKYPDWHLGFAVCLKCHCRTRLSVQVIQRDKFSPADTDKIELSFIKYHVVARVPMTAKEIEGLGMALNAHRFRAM